MTEWPPSGEESQLLDELGRLIERSGAGRFLDVPLVRADRRDFPEPWQPTRAALERLLARLLWLAYVDLDVVIEDARTQAVEEHQRLRRSVIEWLAIEDGAAVFHLERIGNDDVAGLLCHEIGKAFVAWSAPAAPYREVKHEPSAIEGTVAAIYLGLGVPAVNSATRRRAVSEVIGNSTYWEQDVNMRGGLSTYAATYLLAAQAVVRGDSGDALDTLEPTPRAAFDDIVTALRPHRAELVVRLGIDRHAGRPRLERDPEPASVSDAARPEPALGLTHHGAPVFRVPGRRTVTYSVAGLGGGTALILALVWMGVAITASLWLGIFATAGVGGAIVGRRKRYFECATCGIVAVDGAATCTGCGGTFRGQIKHRDLRLEKEEELEREAI